MSTAFRSEWLLKLLLFILLAGVVEPASAQLFRRRSGGGANSPRSTPDRSRQQFSPSEPSMRPAPPREAEFVPVPSPNRPTIREPLEPEGSDDPEVLRQLIDTLQRTTREQQVRLSELESLLKGTQTSARNYLTQIQKLHQQLNTATAAANASRAEAEEIRRVQEGSTPRNDEALAQQQQERDQAIAAARTKALAELQPTIATLEQQLRDTLAELETARKSAATRTAEAGDLKDAEQAIEKLRQELAGSREQFLLQLRKQKDALQTDFDDKLRDQAAQLKLEAETSARQQVAVAQKAGDEQLNQLREQYDTLARQRDALVAAATKAQTDAKSRTDGAVPASKLVNRSVHEAIGGASIERLETVRRQLAALGNSEIAAYRFSTPGQLSLNLPFQTVHGRVAIGGDDLNTGRMQELIRAVAGKESRAPSPRQLVPSQVSPRSVLSRYPLVSESLSSEYSRVRERSFEQRGRTQVGFSSERIVSWVQPRRASMQHAPLDESVSATDIEYEDQLFLELFDAITWFDTHVDRDKLARAYASAAGRPDESTEYLLLKHFVQPVFATLLTSAQRFENEYLTVQAVPVNYERAVQTHSAEASHQVVASPHRAVFFTIKESVLRDDPLNSSVRRFHERTGTPLDERLLGWAAPLTRWLSENPENSVPPLEGLVTRLRNGSAPSGTGPRGVGGLAMSWIGARQELYRQASDALDINQGFIDGIWKAGQSHFDRRNPIVDLRGTEREKRLAAILQALVFGNTGRVTFQRLEFNLANYTINAQFDLEHSHLWKSPEELVDFVNDSLREEFETVLEQVERQLHSAAGPAEQASGR